MREMDDLLDALGDMPAHPRLETMDVAVLSGVAVRRERGAARRGVMLTSMMALGVGLAAGLASPTMSRAGPVSLNVVPPSAPSNLLMGGR